MTATEHGEFADGGVQLTRATDGPGSEHVAFITLSNPSRRNAMRLAMWQALAKVAETLAQTDTRVVVLRGDPAGKAFSAGADISEFATLRSSPEDIRTYNATVARALDALAALPMPVVAVIDGPCIGGGLEIAIRCDLRLGSEDARLAFTPAKLGLAVSPDEIAVLDRIVGPSATAEILFTAQAIDAARAKSLGLINKTVRGEALSEEAMTWAHQIACNAPLTLRAVKAALHSAGRPGDAAAAAHAEALVQTCYDSADYREGQRAFSEKRAPRFSGR